MTILNLRKQENGEMLIINEEDDNEQLTLKLQEDQYANSIS